MQGRKALLKTHYLHKSTSQSVNNLQTLQVFLEGENKSNPLNAALEQCNKPVYSAARRRAAEAGPRHRPHCLLLSLFLCLERLFVLCLLKSQILRKGRLKHLRSVSWLPVRGEHVPLHSKTTFWQWQAPARGRRRHNGARLCSRSQALLFSDQWQGEHVSLLSSFGWSGDLSFTSSLREYPVGVPASPGVFLQWPPAQDMELCPCPQHSHEGGQS